MSAGSGGLPPPTGYAATDRPRMRGGWLEQNTSGRLQMWKGPGAKDAAHHNITLRVGRKMKKLYARECITSYFGRKRWKMWGH